LDQHAKSISRALRLAQLFELPEANIRVIGTKIGAGFGKDAKRALRSCPDA
jgi:hypothetical protein